MENSRAIIMVTTTFLLFLVVEAFEVGETFSGSCNLN